MLKKKDLGTRHHPRLQALDPFQSLDILHVISECWLNTLFQIQAHQEGVEGKEVGGCEMTKGAAHENQNTHGIVGTSDAVFAG